MLNLEGFNNIKTFGSSYKKLDSYNWHLLSLWQNYKQPIFDYVFLDGAHSFPVDALAFFLIDMLLKKGGIIDFDDYNCTHAWHIETNEKKYKEKRAKWNMEHFYIGFENHLHRNSLK